MITNCVCTHVRRGARAMTALYDGALEPVHLNIAQFSLLRHLEHIDASSIAELARVSGHSRSTLARTLRPLEQAGLVQMVTAMDRRARVPRLTNAGRAAIARSLPRWTAAQRRAEAALGTDRDLLFALLDRLDAIQR